MYCIFVPFSEQFVKSTAVRLLAGVGEIGESRGGIYVFIVMFYSKYAWLILTIKGYWIKKIHLLSPT